VLQAIAIAVYPVLMVSSPGAAIPIVITTLAARARTCGLLRWARRGHGNATCIPLSLMSTGSTTVRRTAFLCGVSRTDLTIFPNPGESQSDSPGLMKRGDYSMATYNHLPVYKASYDLLVELFRFTKEFSREYKYTLGESIKKETIEMITGIYRANSSYSKKEIIQSTREKVEVIRLFLRLLKDLRQINLKKFVRLNEKIESVSKQLSAWQKKF